MPSFESMSSSRSDAPPPARSSDGSLFAREPAPDGGSSRRDWVLAMTVFGALIGLVAALRLHPMPVLEMVGLEMILFAVSGALLGALLHRLDRAPFPTTPVERFVRASGRSV